MDYVVIDERSFKEKVSDTFRTAKKKITNGAKAAWENRQTVVPAVLAGITATTTLIGKVNRRRELKEAETRHTRSFYDRSMGCYWETKRPLRTSEMLELEERKANGENYGQILRDMGLLKKVR